MNIGDFIEIAKNGAYGRVSAVSGDTVYFQKIVERSRLSGKTEKCGISECVVLAPKEVSEAEFRACFRMDQSFEELLCAAKPYGNVKWPDVDCVTTQDVVSLIDYIDREQLGVLRADEETFLRFFSEKPSILPYPDFSVFEERAGQVVFPENERDCRIFTIESIVIDYDPEMADDWKDTLRLYENESFSMTITSMKHFLHAMTAEHYARMRNAPEEIKNLFCDITRVLADHDVPDALREMAYAPYEKDSPLGNDWGMSYKALTRLYEINQEPDTANTLGYLCYYGRHTQGKPAYREARKWFKIGAEDGIIESVYKLGDLYRLGLGGKANPKQAEKLYQKCYLSSLEQIQDDEFGCKMADVALRMGLISHGAKSLRYLLEAYYAIRKRERYHEFGDEKVAANICKEIARAMEEAKGENLSSVDLREIAIRFTDMYGAVSMEVVPDMRGGVDLRFMGMDTGARKNMNTAVLWTLPEKLWCGAVRELFVHGSNVRGVMNYMLNEFIPSNAIVFDRYVYDEESHTHKFYLGKELFCELCGGEYSVNLQRCKIREGFTYKAEP